MANANTGTVRLHRVLPTKPEKLYRAFLEADALAKWLPPNGFTCTVEHLDAKVGGSFRMAFRNFTTGNSHSFGGEYLELKPNALIRYTDKFDDPNLPGVMNVTVQIKAVAVGTEVNIEQSGIPAAIPVEACYLGWQESLAQLAALVTPEIPGCGPTGLPVKSIQWIDLRAERRSGARSSAPRGGDARARRPGFDGLSGRRPELLYVETGSVH